MSINEKKEKLINKEITVADLTSTEVEEIRKSVQKDIEIKKNELHEVNQKIKDVKLKIDNLIN